MADNIQILIVQLFSSKNDQLMSFLWKNRKWNSLFTLMLLIYELYVVPKWKTYTLSFCKHVKQCKKISPVQKGHELIGFHYNHILNVQSISFKGFLSNILKFCFIKISNQTVKTNPKQLHLLSLSWITLFFLSKKSLLNLGNYVWPRYKVHWPPYVLGVYFGLSGAIFGTRWGLLTSLIVCRESFSIHCVNWILHTDHNLYAASIVIKLVAFTFFCIGQIILEWHWYTFSLKQSEINPET